MEFGVCVASHIQDIDYVVRAEDLGFSHAWCADSQMLWSDCYATLALAATKTTRIQLGTGIAVTGTRPAPVNAASIATINALAPGRTFFGVGAGNTAMRVMGQPPQRIKDYDRYLGAVKPLLSGGQSEFEGKKIRHIMADKGFANFDDEIPMYVSGFGPKSLALAGKHGEGAVLAMPQSPAVMESVWGMIEAGAASSARSLDRSNFYTTGLTAISILEPGEAVDSDRVKSECGAMAMASVHYSMDQFRNFGHEPPDPLSGIWKDYIEMLADYPEDMVHQRIHAGHNCWVLEEEERFLTPDVLAATCLIGTQDQLIEQFDALHRAGLDQVMVLPNFDTRYEVLERIAKHLIGKVQPR